MDDDVDALFASTSASEEQDTPADTPPAQPQPVSLPIPGLYIVKRWLDEREQVSLFALTGKFRLPTRLCCKHANKKGTFWSCVIDRCHSS